jgi:hypothetical protein
MRRARQQRARWCFGSTTLDGYAIIVREDRVRVRRVPLSSYVEEASHLMELKMEACSKTDVFCLISFLYSCERPRPSNRHHILPESIAFL